MCIIVITFLKIKYKEDVNNIFPPLSIFSQENSKVALEQ